MNTIYLVIERHNGNIYTACDSMKSAEYWKQERLNTTGNTCDIVVMPICRGTGQ